MLKSYFKIVFRNLVRQKGYSFINIVGLAVGMTACFLILLYILHELSYDKYLKKADRIYRIVRENVKQGEFTAPTPFLLAPTLVNEFPEVEKTVRIYKHTEPIQIIIDENNFTESSFLFTDKDFFEIFTYPLIKGNPQTVLKEPFSIVITEKMALKYFNNSEALGNVLTIKLGQELYKLQITGILKNIPLNSHIRADFFASISIAADYIKKWDIQGMLPFSLLEYWNANIVNTYFLLLDKNNGLDIEKKLPALLEQHTEILSNIKYHIQPLTDIHLYSSHIGSGIGVQRNITLIYIFTVIALLILTIACINYINLSTARSMTRLKEIGVRKVIGANRSNLIKQILFESFFIVSLAFLLSLILIEIFLPLVNKILNSNLALNYFKNWEFLLGMIIISILVGVASGAYTAFYISSFNPMNIIKSQINIRSSDSYVRKALIAFQFVIFIALIIASINFFRQMQFLQSKKLGYEKENIMVIKIPDGKYTIKFLSFKNELKSYPNISGISFASFVPPSFGSIGTFEHPEKKVMIGIINADYDYLKTLGLTIKQGRYFSEDFTADKYESVVINETAVNKLGIENPTENALMGDQIIGVLKDFHTNSFYQLINPLIIKIPKDPTTTFGGYSQIAIRLKPGNITETVKTIKDKWKIFFPDDPINFSFMDDEFDRVYREDKQLAKLFWAFTILAISIACIGLYGLSAFTAKQRTKEIGIRKVFGASIPDVLQLLTKEFIPIILIANVIASPIAYYGMNKWLQDFAYRIDIGWWVFVLAGGLALVIALVTVSTVSMKAALANPVEALKYE